MKVKYWRNTTFLETIKIVKPYMKYDTYINVVQKVISINNKSNQLDKYEVLIEALVQLRQN